MISENLGHKLLDLLSEAESEVVLISPFIKHSVILKIMELVRKNVDIKCVTRWRPEEIKNGISDIVVWQALKNRTDTEMYLLPNLHAKYYRSDINCMVGSSNLTQKGLGWAKQSNFELLIPAKIEQDDMDRFEKAILKQARLVDDEIAELTQKAVDRLPETVPITSEELNIIDNYQELDGLEEIWVPVLRHPEVLFDVYLGNFEKMSKVAADLANRDLVYLNIPTLMDEIQFKANVAALLVQEPIICSIDLFLSQPRRFGEVRDYLNTIFEFEDKRRGSSDLWQTLMRWLLLFLPERYMFSRPNYSEIVQRI